MTSIEQYNNELYHYGVKGMKWGVRKAMPRYGARILRGHGGPGFYIGKTRQLAGDKRDLDYLNKGGHLSVGLTKKRQAALDKRDKRLIENRIAKNEKKLANKSPARKAKVESNLEKARSSREAYNDLGFVGKTAYNINAAMRGGFTKSMGNALYSIGKAKYNSLNGVGTPGQVAALKGIGIAANALKAIGDIQVTTAAIREVQAINERKKR